MTYSELESVLLDLISRSVPGAVVAEEEFNALALEVYRFQWENNEAYRKFCEYSGVGVELDDWRSIPAVPTSAFRHAALRTFPESEVVTSFRTSGTTGEGFGVHYFRSLALYEASILQGWKALGIPELPQVILTPRPSDSPHSSLVHMMVTLREVNTPGAEQFWCIGQGGEIDIAALERSAAAGPILLLGTALAFLHLFERLGNRSIALVGGSIAMETGGYKGTGRTLAKHDLYAMFAAKLGLHADSVVNEYSMTELSSQWYTRGLGNPHYGPQWARALIVDPRTGLEVGEGETGSVRLIDLANLGSVLAIQTQDLAVKHGQGFELLGRDPKAIPRGCSRSADELLGRGGR
jgi:hypothetical protein